MAALGQKILQLTQRLALKEHILSGDAGRVVCFEQLGFDLSQLVTRGPTMEEGLHPCELIQVTEGGARVCPDDLDGLKRTLHRT